MPRGFQTLGLSSAMSTGHSLPKFQVRVFPVCNWMPARSPNVVAKRS